MFYEPTIIKNPEKIFRVVRKYISNPEDIERIKHACRYVEDKFKEIKRKNGDPYVYHLYTAAYLVAKWNCSPTVIIAALLHDLVEDIEGETFETVKKEFGGEAAFLVDKLTKIRLFEKAHYIDIMGAYMRKILLGMSQDVRVMVIKMADRFNNIETLNYLRPEKQVLYAKETSEVYVPIAKALGFNDWANYIDNLCFYYYDRKEFEKVDQVVKDMTKSDIKHIDDVKKLIGKELKKTRTKYHEIQGRIKSNKSVAKKLAEKGTSHDIYDLFAIRIICDDIPTCYTILGNIHQAFPVVPNRFKDYISAPKGNMYQSLHTTIIIEGQDVEIQIRTQEMDRVAEDGIAAHWKYKEGNYSREDQQQEMLGKINILKNIIKYDESQEDSNQTQAEWWTELQEEVLGEKIICLTPRKKAIELRRGSTALDFAFHIHTEVGLKAIRAIINGKPSPLKTKLNSGDIVEIKTKLTRNVSDKWLDWAISITARNRIKKALKEREASVKKIEDESKIISGENALKNALKGWKLNKKYLDHQKEIEKFLIEDNKLTSISEVYVAINKDRTILNRLQKHIFNNFLTREEQLTFAKKDKNKKSKKDHNVIIGGVSGIKSIFAKCCNPIYGDEIIAVTSRTSGAKIHKASCSLTEPAKERGSTFEAEWGRKGDKKFVAKLFIKAINHSNTINLILSFFGSLNIEIKAFNTKFEGDSKLNMTISLMIGSIESLETLIRSLHDVNDVIEVIRI